MIWFAIRENLDDIDQTPNGMDMLTMSVVMGQGLADVVVFGESRAVAQTRSE